MKPIELECWEPSPDDPRRKVYAGQRTAQEVFEELKYRLEGMGYLPDEYFLMDREWENGREIPAAAPDIPADTDLLIVMLGTNDLLQGRSPGAAAERMERFLTGLELAPEKVLLIAPPPLSPGEWVTDQPLIAASQTFARCCRTLAGRLGIRFADAGRWNVSPAYDGVHFTEQGHRAFAAGLFAVSAISHTPLLL